MSGDTVVVFGVTGVIGSSVAKALAGTYKVKGITRNPDSNKSQALTSCGVDLISVDITNPKSLDCALTGAYGCFVVTHCDFGDPDCEANEIRRGRAIAEACKRARVQHVVYSTQMSVVRTIGLNARHMDAKAEIERQFKELGVPVSSVIVPLLYENFLEPPFRPKRLAPNCYGLDIPLGRQSLYLIGAEDLGPVVLAVFCQRQSWLNKTLSICGDKRSLPELVAILDGYCRGVQFQQSLLTLDQWESDHRFPGSSDYKAMLSFYLRVDQQASVDLTQKMHPGVLSFQDWVARNTDRIEESLSFPDTPAQDPWACL